MTFVSDILDLCVPSGSRRVLLVGRACAAWGFRDWGVLAPSGLVWTLTCYFDLGFGIGRAFLGMLGLCEPGLPLVAFE